MLSGFTTRQSVAKHMFHQGALAKQICREGPVLTSLVENLLSNVLLVARLLSNGRGGGAWWQVCLAIAAEEGLGGKSA